jgi:hypothetical protein
MGIIADLAAAVKRVVRYRYQIEKTSLLACLRRIVK